MKNYKFNKFYVIESLSDNEDKTGKLLYDDLIRRQEYIYENLKTEYRDINNKEDWNLLMQNVLNECSNGIIPLFHLEMHGNENGLGFKDGTFISREEVCKQFRKINIASGFNLFITLGVCNGLYLLFDMKMTEPMAFIGAIGSFDKLYDTDIEIRYTEFYDSFFKTFNVGTAYDALLKANSISNLKSKYRYIPADELFYVCYCKYLKNKCSETALKERAKESISGKVSDRRGRRIKEREFIKTEKKNREKYYHSMVNKFFMTDKFPQNKQRFEIPNNFNELKIKYENNIIES